MANISSSEYPISTTSVRNVIFTKHVFRRSLSSFLVSLPRLYSVSSAPALMVSFVGSLLRPVSSLQLSSSSGDASPSAILLILSPTSPSYSPDYAKDTFLQGSWPRRNPLSLSVCCVFRHSGNGLDEGGRFIPADIVGVHTLSLLLSSWVTHGRATEDNHTQHTGSKLDVFK